MSWKYTRPPSGGGARPSVLAIRCPHCRARFQRSGHRIPLYAVFSCHSCGARLVRQQSLVVVVSAPATDAAEPVDRAG